MKTDLLGTYSAPQRYLKSKGWRIVRIERHGYADTTFWAHDIHQPDESLSWNQSYTMAFQHELNKIEKARSKGQTGC